MNEIKTMKQYFRNAVLLYLLLAAISIPSHAADQGGARGAKPIFEAEPGWLKLPEGMVMGFASGVAVDEQDNVWILHRYRASRINPFTKQAPREAPGSKIAPPIVIFDKNGNFVRAWGGPGDGYDWPQNEHGISIDPDGFVWVTGSYCAERNSPGLRPVDDNQVVKFTRDGEFVMQIGTPGQSSGNLDEQNLNRPTKVVLHPPTNELFISDGYSSRRVIVFDATTGKFKRLWGAFGNSPDGYNGCGPWPINGEFNWDPDQFTIVHDIAVSQDGLVYVADREGKQFQVFTSGGEFVNRISDDKAAYAVSVAFSPDAEQRYLYTAWVFPDYSEEIRILDRQTLEVIAVIEDDEFRIPGHQMAVDSQGNIYTSGMFEGFQRYSLKGFSNE